MVSPSTSLLVSCFLNGAARELGRPCWLGQKIVYDPLPVNIPGLARVLSRLVLLKPKKEHIRQIWEAMQEAFKDHWGYVPESDIVYEAWQAERNFQPDMWKVAWDGDQVAGR